ncbi:MAG: hypothetical protein Q7J85_12430 [Bacillota bacterium]|nr:hypothetical protein [Bacillota bacterium]
MAKKFNKSKEQKPNYSKRGNNNANVEKDGKIRSFSNLNVESGTDFDLANKIKEQKNKNLCLEDNGDQCFNPKKK